MNTFSITTVDRSEWNNESNPVEVRESVLASFALRANSTRDAANWVIRNLSDDRLGYAVAGGSEVFQLDSWAGEYSRMTVWRITPVIR